MKAKITGKLYPIPIDDYPKLLRYQVTLAGVHYIEDLIREIYVDQKPLSMNKLMQLGLLLKTYVCQTKRIENDVLFQDVSNRAKKYGGMEPTYLKQCIKNLIMRGLLGPNPKYDPQIAISMRRKNSNIHLF